MLEVILDHNISFPAVQAPFPAHSEENYELSFSKLVKVLHDPFYVGIASPTGEVLKEVLVDDIGFMTMIFRPTQTRNHYIYVRSSGVTSAQESSFYTVAIDDVLIRNISQEGYSLLGYSDYYPFGMTMPNRNVEGDYRYAFQGQEKDLETGKEAFELRLWDGRIGRWLTTDPAGQYSSPYLGMGNNPLSRVDPDGGFDWVYDKENDTYFWDENVTSPAQIDDPSKFEYVGIGRSDIDTHFENNNNWLVEFFSSPEIDTQSFKNYLDKSLTSVLQTFLNTKEAQRFDNIRGIYENWNTYIGGTDSGFYLFYPKLTLDGADSVNANVSIQFFIQHKKYNVISSLEGNHRLFNGVLQTSYRYPFQYRFRSLHMQSENAIPILTLQLPFKNNLDFSEKVDSKFGVKTFKLK